MSDFHKNVVILHLHCRLCS